MAAKAPITWKKGTVTLTRYHGRNNPTTKVEVSGWVSSSGLAVHKGDGRTGYTVTQTRSGIAVVNADTFAEAKEKANRIAGVTNWHKEVKPSFDLAQKVRAAERGEKYRKPSNKLKDAYDLKAYSRKHKHIVDHEQTRGYEAQQKVRGRMNRSLRSKHIAYTINATNTTKNRRIK